MVQAEARHGEEGAPRGETSSQHTDFLRLDDRALVPPTAASQVLPSASGPTSINALIGFQANSRKEFNESPDLDSADLTDDEVARYLSHFREGLAEQLLADRPLQE